MGKTLWKEVRTEVKFQLPIEEPWILDHSMLGTLSKTDQNDLQ